MSASWAVVATVDEPAPLVAAFVAHHLNEGAQAVHLFLDRADPETAGIVRGLKGCLLTRCNKDHWAAHNGGTRPYLHTRRQIINANIAYHACTADWLVHCDADEFIRDGRAMAKELAETPDGRDHLRLRVSERVMPAGIEQTGLFDGIFRLPISEEPRRLDVIYHPVEAFMDRGLTGHPNGKGAVRTGRGMRLNIHQPQGEVPSWPITSTRLLHFDGLTRFHYLLKLLRRAHEKDLPGLPRHKPGRMAQLTAMKENAADPAFFNALVEALKTLRPDQRAALERLELIEAAPFTPNLGGLALDLSVSGFDASLRRRQADFLESIGFQG